MNVVAKSVNLTIKCPEGFIPLSIVGREGRIKDRTVSLHLNQLYGGQEKYALIEIDIPVSLPGDTKEVAHASVSYVNALTQKKETSSSAANARFSEEQIDIANSANSLVQRAFEFNRNALAQEAAIEMADNGNNAEAAKNLKDSAEQLRTVAFNNGDISLLEKAKEVEEQADQIEQQGMTNKNRKGMRADSFQTMNQQKAQ